MCLSIMPNLVAAKSKQEQKKNGIGEKSEAFELYCTAWEYHKSLCLIRDIFLPHWICSVCVCP